MIYQELITKQAKKSPKLTNKKTSHGGALKNPDSQY